jgi:hypothetical protein
MIKTYDVIVELCKEIHPTSSYEMHGDLANITDLSILTLDGGSTTLSFTFDDVEKKQISMQAEYDAQEYARNRKAEYDALNQLEMQFDDKKNSTTTWDDAIDAIKAKWPKDNSGPV